MTENRDKQDDKGKEKEEEKDKNNEKNKLTHLVDTVGRKYREKGNIVPSVLTTSGGTTPAMVVAGATSAIVLGDEIRSSIYMTNCSSFQSEILTIDVDSGELLTVDRLKQLSQSQLSTKDEAFGTQRVYKKTSSNSSITLYLPTREIVLTGSTPTILCGIVFVDPSTVQGYRIYAQLTLTFRYGREDEEVMGLRFCNEAIMSLHQVWPRTEDPSRQSLSPLQDALIKRLGEGAHPFTLSLTPQAPPSVQLVPAKRYYGAPIGTSYEVRCFMANKTEEKFHRRASVKMGVRVIYRTDVHHENAPENYAAFINSQISPPVSKDQLLLPRTRADSHQLQHQLLEQSLPSDISPQKTPTGDNHSSIQSCATHIPTSSPTTASNTKARKSERGDSFPKLRLSPKSFRFSGRFGRSKSEIEKCPSDSFYNYSKSFQEYETGGPQGSVDKPFLLQEGRVSLRASLDKAWYTHAENVIVNVDIRNDSRKTVRKVCAIQHVDVCMFNNGKFKNIVADSDNNNSHVDRTVNPGGKLNATFILKPQRGPTKNWIALEDTLQRSTEPEEITGAIAASAIRSPTVAPLPGITPSNSDDRNIFAIYVSYYVKIKLALSGMGGELSLKLPFVLVHIDELLSQPPGCSTSRALYLDAHKLNLDNVPTSRKNLSNHAIKVMFPDETLREVEPSLDRIESVENELNIPIPEVFSRSHNVCCTKRKLLRSETIAKDLIDDEDGTEKDEDYTQDTQLATDSLDCNNDIVFPRDNINQDVFPVDENDKKEHPDSDDEVVLSRNQQLICAQVHSEL
ncbi:uncharacterized protein LOC129910214 isoform X2 [Episyrphus balteatus]|uniref:uncharacterized protein LOC129910214 isoform X2 n=1 Tax=Episyrphus balteatus TaxID=286459 RepID=UPI002486BE57|nr:uncharacterized protein LOC129910214 isoform X2 [Episyrphus balteatus]